MMTSLSHMQSNNIKFLNYVLAMLYLQIHANNKYNIHYMSADDSWKVNIYFDNTEVYQMKITRALSCTS